MVIIPVQVKIIIFVKDLACSSQLCKIILFSDLIQMMPGNLPILVSLNLLEFLHLVSFVLFSVTFYTDSMRQ